MNRFVQKLIAGAAAVAIAVTGLVGAAPVAKAAEPVQPTEGTITIRNADNDEATHTLDGFQLASLKNVDSAGGKLTFLIDTNDDLVSVIEASMTDAQRQDYEADHNYYNAAGSKDNNPIGYLVANVFNDSSEPDDPWGGNTSELRKFATRLSKKLAVDGVHATKTGFQSSISGFKNTCDQGLWFLKDTTDDPATQSIPIIVATALKEYSNETASWGVVTLKMNVPTVDKKITSSDTGTVAKNGSNADALIGGKVEYELSSVIPTYTGYDINEPPRVFRLIDTASKGLTVDENPVKSVKSVTLKKDGEDDVTLDEGTDYTVNIDDYRGTDSKYTGGHVTTIDLGKYVNMADGSKSKNDGKILEGYTVVVKFEAIVNSSAVMAGDGNPNSVELEYSRTPNNESTTIHGPKVPRVYTYEFGILKTDMAGAKTLDGAQFAIARVDATTKDKTFLKRDAKTGAWSELTTATPVKDGTEATGVFTTGADGKIEMSGLPKGTYYVEEIKAPTGYTNIGLPNFEFTISADFDADGMTVKNLEYKQTTGADDSRIAFDATTRSQANVKNAKNLTELPLTGDLGIKVFITVGVLLMAAGAAFALSARMRS